MPSGPDAVVVEERGSRASGVPMPTTTRAAVMWAPGRPWEVVELDLDDPRRGEVQVRFEATGLCHSDDHVRTGDMQVRYPIVGGHEAAGVVERVGPGVHRVKAGDHVVCSYIPVCGTCRYCSTGRQNLCDAGRNAVTGMLLDDTFRFHSPDDRDVGGMCAIGAFAQRAVISEYSCVPLHDDIPFELAAIVACAVPTGWGSAVYAAGVRAGQTVVIYGCGGVGANAVQGASSAGVRNVVVVDPVPFKLEKAREMGATHTFTDPEEARRFVRSATRGQYADHAIITVGVNDERVVASAIAVTGKGGRVTITSTGRASERQVMAYDGLLVAYQRQVQGALFGSCNPLYDIPRLIDLWRSGDLKLDELITKRYTLDELNDGYRDLLDGRNIRGVLLHEH
jgi:alcohol dehydrogenase (nicotinoprotein)